MSVEGYTGAEVGVRKAPRGEYSGSSPMGGGGRDRLHTGWTGGSSLSTGECEYEGTPILK